MRDHNHERGDHVHYALPDWIQLVPINLVDGDYQGLRLMPMSEKMKADLYDHPLTHSAHNRFMRNKP